ncbi:ATP synthase subunit f, mitochondrial isoform X1 [Fukomys damarensis]|uniref:ATP synthase subunit f, mitochondrial isoform X1 n=1 Tax=Fukomys damarensis TaxID=885580 RepID=UPI0005403557|nr:ATP synthase subunit f, mitochondrial isoform X1 [Fukomys damarensis]
MSLCSPTTRLKTCSLPGSSCAALFSGQQKGSRWLPSVSSGLLFGRRVADRGWYKVPVKEKKLMDVKLGELPSWILMRDFTPSGIVGAFQRGYYRYYNKYINVKKGSIAGLNMVLAAYVLFSYCFSYKELKHERRRKYH